MIRIASLFSGIGGFEKGIQQAADKLNIDVECVFASENDKYARQIYRKNFGVEPHGDITEINAADVPDHDILCGGFPCQDVSIAGKREGLCGARSGLFFDLIRIIREKQPELIFLENVKGILSSSGGWDFAKILIELEDAGYSCEWQVCNTASFLPQNRERVFIIGHLTGSERCGRKIFPIRKSGDVVDKEEPTVYTLDANYYKGQAKQSRTMILCDSGPGRKTQLRNETIAPLRANTGAGHNNIVCHSTLPRNSISGKGGIGHLQREDGLTYCCDANNNLAVEVTKIAKCLIGGGHSGGNHSDMTILNINYLNPETHNRGYGNAKKTNTIEILRVLWETIGKRTGERWGFTEFITLLEAEVLQSGMYEKSVQVSLEEGYQRRSGEISCKAINCCNRMLEMWKQEKFRYTSYRQKRIEQLIGELTSSVQELSQLRSQKEREMQNMWETDEGTGILQQTLPQIQKMGEPIDSETQSIHRTQRIRRLTPYEIERLQGFPLGWTEEGVDDDGNIVKISDTQRYKVCGNAVSVPVIKFIAERILKIL